MSRASEIFQTVSKGLTLSHQSFKRIEEMGAEKVFVELTAEHSPNLMNDRNLQMEDT